jgi:hypothetical protein
MKLSELKQQLGLLEQLRFLLPDGNFVPSHFHITEVGLLTRNFIDCGGKLREKKKINLQLWYTSDTEHRLKPAKLLRIIEQSEKHIDLGDHEIEIEYQLDTIGKFGLELGQKGFQLTSKQTACLAEDQCGIPISKPKMNLRDVSSSSNCCTPGTKCC